MAAVPVSLPRNFASCGILAYAGTGGPEHSADYTTDTWSTASDIRWPPTSGHAAIMGSRRVVATARANPSCTPLAMARPEPR